MEKKGGCVFRVSLLPLSSATKTHPLLWQREHYSRKS